jgi:hypothetical protein
MLRTGFVLDHPGLGVVFVLERGGRLSTAGELGLDVR